MQQADSEKLQLTYKLLEQTTSISVVSNFLKSKSLKYSAGSWVDLVSKRIQPRIDDASITTLDLVMLLRSVEEYGRQHTLLYKCSPEIAIDIMGRQRIGSALAKNGSSDILTNPLVFDQPKDPILADVRWRSATVDLDMTVKEIESRENQTYIGTESIGDKVIKTYAVQRERCVNVAVLKRTGELEVRVTSRTGLSGYDKDVRKFMTRIKEFIPIDQFVEVSLARAKKIIYQNRSKFIGKIRFSDLTFKNDDDITTRASTGTIEADLISHESTVSILDIAAKSGYCQSSNLWFVKSNPLPSRDIHVLLSGELNEFSINASCNEEDYRHVLEQIRAFNV